MNSYWDLSEVDRARMTRDEVETYLGVHLMECGIAKPPQPVLEDATPPKLETTQFFGIQYKGTFGKTEAPFVFDTPEQASAFIDLSPRVIRDDYRIDSKTKWVGAGDMEFTIAPVELASEAGVNVVREHLQRVSAIKDRNRRIQDEYDKALERVTQSTSQVWNDWVEQTSKLRRADVVHATYAEYRDLCDCDVVLARKFLAKAYSEERIVEAAMFYPEVREPECVPIPDEHDTGN